MGQGVNGDQGGGKRRGLFMCASAGVIGLRRSIWEDPHRKELRAAKLR